MGEGLKNNKYLQSVCDYIEAGKQSSEIAGTACCWEKWARDGSCLGFMMYHNTFLSQTTMVSVRLSSRPCIWTQRPRHLVPVLGQPWGLWRCWVRWAWEGRRQGRSTATENRYRNWETCGKAINMRSVGNRVVWKPCRWGGQEEKEVSQGTFGMMIFRGRNTGGKDAEPKWCYHLWQLFCERRSAKYLRRHKLTQTLAC